MSTPRLEINLGKIANNLEVLTKLYGLKNISICAVTKVVCGNIDIAHLLVKGGIKLIADSRIANLRKMRIAGVQCQFVLLGPPRISELASVVKYADISLNTEISVIRLLSTLALARGIRHKIILMLEYGDLREGIMPKDLEEIVKQALPLKGIELIGIGTNLCCFGGVRPDREKMRSLSSKAVEMEKKFGIHLQIISGGNSANYLWYSTAASVGRINNLRLGESIFLGRETVNMTRIPELFIDAFTLVVEVTELKTKPSVPYGKIGRNAFGEIPVFKDLGIIKRAILGIGRQDIVFDGLTPEEQIQIIGGSSDHMIINPQQSGLKLGSEVRFNVNYPALLAAMTSPYILKVNTPKDERTRILHSRRSKRYPS